MNRDEALTLVREFVKNENLVKHMLAVEACMRFYAQKFGEEAESWGLLGLLHDFDWEIHPTLEEHPMAGAPILRARGVPEDIIQDILSHADRTGVPRNTLRRKALYACDEITGFVTAVALVRPSRSLLDLEVSSVRKKWKDKAFAAGAERANIEQATADFGVEIWEHVGNVIAAMRGVAPQLGLAGNDPKSGCRKSGGLPGWKFKTSGIKRSRKFLSGASLLHRPGRRPPGLGQWTGRCARAHGRFDSRLSQTLKMASLSRMSTTWG